MIGYPLLLIAIGVAVAIAMLKRRIDRLEQALQAMEARVDRLQRDGAAATSAAAIPYVVAPDVAAPIEPAPEHLASISPELDHRFQHAASAAETTPSAPAFTLPRLNFETLVGGRLPIWIGGVALVLAGFFLVRYSIEQGLLGPGARTCIAALFGLLLVAASEAVRRLPATRDDARLGQALAGAGIASLYGTLYMAAALYHLIAPIPAFGAVVLVTLGAMGLSLRHGPPTAIMALVGGFVAPLVAGFDAAGIGPLLVYLGLFVAALFGLAVHRRWGWLAFAASFAGLAWAQFLIAVLDGRGSLASVGGFTMLVAGGASAALPVAGIRNRWLRLAPLLVGLLQLVAIAPGLDFGPLAWSFYLVLAAATLVLAWRDPLYLPGALASLVLLLALEGLAFTAPHHGAAPVAAVVATLLFAGAGQWLWSKGRLWVLMALLGAGGPVLVAHAFAQGLLPDLGWTLCELAAAVACARLAWCLARDRDDPALTAATAMTGLLATVAIAQALPSGWRSVAFALALGGLALWARRVQARALFALPVLPLIATVVGGAVHLAMVALVVGQSLGGERLLYAGLPLAGDLLRQLALPTLAAIAFLVDPRAFGRWRRAASAVAAALAVLMLYVLAKQPLAIASIEQFLAWGFIERALLTQLCLGTGWGLLRSNRLPVLGRALLLLGLARLLWFDGVLLNAAFVAQRAGPLLALHFGLAAFWCWTLPKLRVPAALLSIAAALAVVRWLAHGMVLTGPMSSLENGGYSAVLLVLALGWLWRGIAASRHDLRLAGLGLLTATTFKVFLVDAAALDGLLRILSFLGLGVALIAIGWAYSRFLARPAAAEQPVS
ncbi:DUF2339 domain-containing protein [Sphingomonas sp. TDK1]|uniref:DUF2339 domain-containing protein n=1 Tax=Sphingomonas sp. TDK1 TaxID=453247 RepID=UPI0007D95C85|nr:DUF2339 domain-containing protein [Sphingomonas sp. TDK1]OAN64853.1 hypothetical protein A7X12_17440 [Sphingomonas sp. TDK1]